MLSWESLHSIAVGGIAQHVTELAAALERAGHDVHVFTRMASGQRYHDYIDGVHYHRCPYPGHHDFVDDVNNMCRAFVERVFIMEDLIGPFDIVHAHDWLTANAMIWIKQGRGRRCALTIHSTEYGRCGNAFHDGRAARIRAQERAGTYWADKIICVSNALKSEIMWMYEVPEYKATVVYNGVSSHRFVLPVDVPGLRRRYGISPADPIILFCGRLEWQKGPDLLVEAVPSILRHHPDTKFIFAGDGGMREGLERRVRGIGAEHSVRFLGYRRGAEIVELFRMSDSVCVPSRNEPFGIVILEAWSAGAPVVVTKMGGPGEFVQDGFNGLKVFPDPDSIARGLGRLLSDLDLARRMGANGRQVVLKRFGWDVIAPQTLGVYGFRAEAPVEVEPSQVRGKGCTGRIRKSGSRRQRAAIAAN